MQVRGASCLAAHFSCMHHRADPILEATMPSIAKGDVLLGKYQIQSVLGEGGMGIVAAAWHLNLQQHVAIKVLQPAIAYRKDVAARFIREARAASRIQHENVVRILDADTLPNGAPFLVMEYLEGVDLEQLRIERRRLPHEEAVRYVLEACKGLAEAHEMGIVHRDVKPSNFFLVRKRNGQTCVKVLDFGISKLLEDPAGELTRTGVTLGSPRYMSPEQARSAKDVDARTDIWSVGTTLYELCTGKVAFEGEALADIFSNVLNVKPIRPRVHVPDIPLGLEKVILRCLEKDRNRRYPNIGALMQDLQPFATARAIAATIPGAPLGIATNAPSDRRYRIMLVSAISLLCMVVLALGLSFWPASQPETVATTAASPEQVEFNIPLPTPPAPSTISPIPSVLDSNSVVVTPAPTAAPPSSGEEGFLTIVCNPFCDEIIDNGRSLGPSPIVHLAVKPGSHRLMAKKGSMRKTIDVIVVSGQVTAQRLSMK